MAPRLSNRLSVYPFHSALYEERHRCSKPKSDSCSLEKWAVIAFWFCTVLPTQKTRHVETMVFWCWASVADAGPTIKHHCFNVLCLLERWNLFPKLAHRIGFWQLPPNIRPTIRAALERQNQTGRAVRFLLVNDSPILEWWIFKQLGPRRVSSDRNI